METPNLIDILTKKTEPKKGAVDPSDFSQKETDQVKPNADDFTEPEKKEEEQPKIEEKPKGDFNEYATPPPTKPEKPRLSEEQYRNNAKMWIALADGLGTISLPYLYQKSMFTKAELKLLKDLNRRKKEAGSSGEITLTPEDLALMDKYEVFKELKENVPYTEDEIAVAEPPLTEMFSKYNLQPGPEMALISAALIILTPRLLPLLTGLEK